MNELYHYGVKGMRWGVRNAETKARYRREHKIKGSTVAKIVSPTGYLAYKGVKKGKDKIKSSVQNYKQKKWDSMNEEAKNARKNPKTMSNDELVRATNRLNLEGNYNSAKRRANPGYSAVTGILNTSGQQTVNAAGNAAGNAIGKKVAKKVLTKI